FFFPCLGDHRYLHSFPTRRSSDLYSAKGDLGLIWKTNYADRTYDVWSSASLDGGRKFKTVRVSHAVSPPPLRERANFGFGDDLRSEEHTSELQSLRHLVCRLLLEK